MNNSGFDYLLKKTLGDNSRLALYYDFNQGSVGVHSGIAAAGYDLTGTVLNVYPGPSGHHNLLVFGCTGNSTTTTVGAIVSSVQTNFLMGGSSGNLAFSNAKITGVMPFHLNNCTFLFSAKKTGGKAGVIYGSLKNVDETYEGSVYRYSTGYNFGLTSRNKLFFNGLGENQEYVLIADEIELANKNICAVSVGQNRVSFARFDLATNQIEEQGFAVDTENIKDPQGTLGFLGGGSISFYNPGSNFSGIVDKLAIFSGIIESNDCLSLASGFATSLSWTAASIEDRQLVTGYQTQILYNTGYTGVNVSVTGTFLDQISGIFKTFGASSGASLLSEGSLFDTGRNYNNTYFNDIILETVGAILEDFQYLPTGSTAAATLGIDNAQTMTFMGFNTEVELFSTPSTTGILQFFPSGVTGLLLNEPTGHVQIPLYKSFDITGEASYLLTPETGRMLEYKYDMLYYLGERL